MTPIVGLFLGLVALADDPPATLPPAASRPVDFARDVRPILAASCAGCHGAKKRKGGLSLEGKAEALAGGDEGPAIVPGHGAESRLIRYVAGLDEDHAMPPEGSGERLTSDQVGILRGWIDQGATWPDEAGKGPAGADHWSFKPPVRPPLPEVRDPSWPRNPIDRFVLARLEKDGLRPSPEADRVTLIRRLSLDLIGLPPTIAEVDAFVADGRPDAYERQVDRLLASPHYGERWARRWLDGARYADTNGYEKDRERSIWPYRDWVIRALDADLPFDRFTVEQVAGDLLPGATEAQVVATGFHRNTMINEEGGIDVEEFRFASLVDRVATTGAVWLGLTVQCAQCHTHKYDPITQRDYYRLLAFFNNADEPDLDLADPAVAARRAEVGRKIADLEAALPSRFPDEDPRLGWSALMPSSVKAESGAKLTIRPDASVAVSGPAADTDRYDLEAWLDMTNVTAIRLEALADPDLPKSGPGRAPNGNFVLTDLAASLAPVDGSEPRPVAFASAEADVAQAGFPVNQAIDGKPETGWAVDAGAGQLNRDHSATFVLAGKPPVEGRTRLRVRLAQDYGGQHTLGRFRISARRRPLDPPGSTPETRRRDRLAARQAEWEASLRPTRWEIRPPGLVESAKGATLDILADGSVLASGDKPNNDTYRVEIPADRGPITAIRLEVLPDPSLPDGGPGRAPLFSVGNFFLSEAEVAAVGPDRASRPLAVAAASADYAEPEKAPEGVLDGKLDTGWSVGGAVGKPHALVLRLAEPLGPSPGSRLVLTLKQAYIHQTTIGRFRVSTTNDADPPAASGLPAEVEAVALIPRADRTAGQAAVLDRHFLAVAPELAGANEEIAALRRGLPAFPATMVMRERPPSRARTTHVHRRGEFLRPADPVSPAIPAVLTPLPPGAPADRLAFARWLVDGKNPLVGRVVMNRAWQAFFGRGLVATLDDFGTRGERPTHPELLDWLAVEFPARGWSQKAMHRLIVTSATYRQSSAVAADLLALDPRNERLARGPRFRVDAEMIRDIALSAAGLLDGRVGGPSVFPPQPDGVSSLAYGQAGWPTSRGADRYRRALYTYLKRTAPFAASATFDAPSSETACVRRERSNTPLQALTLLNDPSFVEAARALGRRVVAEGPSDPEGRARFAFRLCVGRVPSDAEVAPILAFRDRQAGRMASGDLDPKAVNGGDSADPDRAAWTAVARALLNLDETITKE